MYKVIPKTILLVIADLIVYVVAVFQRWALSYARTSADAILLLPQRYRGVCIRPVLIARMPGC